NRRCHRAGNLTANHAKYTKRNPRPAATDPQNSLWPLCLGGENNHGVTESTEKTQTLGWTSSLRATFVLCAAKQAPYRRQNARQRKCHDSVKQQFLRE